MAQFRKSLLLRTRDLFIRELKTNSTKTVVCFTPWISTVPRSEFNSEGFAEGIFVNHGVNELHVIARDNHWYQVLELVQFLKDYKKNNSEMQFYTYGSSMGGFAALLFAEILEAKCISISPQFSIDREIVPFEKRWSTEASKLNFEFNIKYSKNVQGVIFSDSKSIDNKHTDMILKKLPNVKVWRKDFVGHPAGKALNDLIGLKKIITDYVVYDQLDLLTISKQYERSAKNFDWYWENLSYQFFIDDINLVSEYQREMLLNTMKTSKKPYYIKRLLSRINQLDS